ncbi:MAG: Gfo/Idh/MocA family protein [Phototrophicaceae bacterium]|jgi:predicted dehydrogenase
MADKIRWGILGAARIGRRVIPAIHNAPNAEVVAVASRSRERAEAYAKEHGIPKVFDTYEAMLNSGEIDAVYNPLPNHQHAPMSIAAAEAGLACLCEKPLALNASEAQSMVDAFAERGQLLAEAFMYRFHPQHDRVRALIADGAIGKLQMIDAAFTFNIADEQDIRMFPEMGGGGIYDVGCYCINSIRLLTGEEPDGGQAFGRFGKSDVDEMLSATLSFPSGVLAHFDCGFRALKTNYYDVRGTEGRIRVEPSYSMDTDQIATIHVWRGKADTPESITVPAVDQYQLMIEDFCDALLNKRPFRFPVEDAVKNMVVIDNLLASARGQDGYWF